jgi:hypothetical protein
MLAIMVGWLWDRWAARALPDALRLHAWIWGAIAAGLALMVLIPPRARAELQVLLPPTLPGKLVLVGLLLAAAVLAVVAARGQRPLATFAAICVPMVLVLAYENRVYVTEHNRAFDIKSFAERLAAGSRPADQLVAYRYQHLSLEFYSGRPVVRVLSPDHLRTLVSLERPVYVVADDRGWRSVADATGRPWGIVHQAQIAGRKLIIGTTAARP